MVSSMSEFSPLRDPVFLLTWQVHLAVVILFALLGIWAGTTRRPWYVAPTLFLGLLWLFVPLEAPEPAVVLLLSVPVLALLCRVARRWLEKPREESSGDSQSCWRFSLADLLWLTLIVGMLTALLIQAWPMPLKMHWPDIALSACCFVFVGVATAVAMQQTTWKRRLMAATMLLAVIGAAAWIHQLLLEKDWLLLVEWKAWITLPLGPPPLARSTDPFAVYLLTFLQCAVVLALGLHALQVSSANRRPPRLSMVAQISAGGLLLAQLAGLGWFYSGMLDRPAPPDERWPDVNEREAFLAILDRHRQLNRKEESLDDLKVSAGPQTAQAMSDLLVELDALLQRDSITHFDSRSDKPDHSTNLVEVQAARSVARTLRAQAQADWQAGRRSEALGHDLLCLRLGRALGRRGIMVDALVGVALEGIALHRIAEIRSELSIAESEQIEKVLDRVAQSREPLDLLLARERFFVDRAGGWRGRLSAAVNRILGSENKPDFEAAFGRRDAMLSLMRTDLAIRRYQKRHGDWPEALAAIVPDELEAVPIDPFSKKSLVYRVAGDDFVLYSVGQDGVDDGGKSFDMQYHRTPGYDLALETWLREWQ
jgi:hypothetical protein